MPDAIITSTASTFGTISGTFSADQSTITGTVTGIITGTLSGSVGVPGPVGPGVPAGGLEGQIIVKASETDYDTVWADNSAETLTATVRNETGATLTKGTVVYINGAAGNKATVTKASAASESGSSKTFAILKDDIPNNQNGTAVTVGLLKGVDTSAFSPGANLWLSTTAGQITQTMPTSPNHAVFLGNAVRIHANQGEIEVRIQNGLELGELHDVLIHDVANGQVLKYDSAQGLWVNGTDSAGVAWGSITGTLSNQTDLQSALDGKYSTSNPAGYITSSALSPYLTSATAASTYQTIAGMSSYLTTADAATTYYLNTNPDAFITASALTGYATESWVTAQGYITSAALSGYATESWVTSQGYLTSAPVTSVAGRTGAITLSNTDISGLGTMATATAADYSTTTVADGLYYPLSSNPAGYLTSASLTGYATESWVTAGFYPLTGNPSSFLVAADIAGKANTASPALTGNVTITTNSTSPALVITQDGTGDVVQFKDATSDTTYSFIDLNGKVNTVASTTTSAGFNVPHGTAPTSPVNGDIWTTTGNLWVRINGFSQAVALQGSSAQLSTNNIFTNASSTYGNSTAAGTINLGTGATVSGSTKALNIGTGGVAGSTTTITIGSNSGGTSTTTLQGTTNGVTAAADTNSTALATTAFVVGQAGSATPLVNGTAAVGTSLRYARQDHVHPTDTSRAALSSPAFTGTPTAPTATAGTNTTQIATTAFVTAAVPALATLTDSRQLTNDTKAMSPFDVRWSLMTQDYIDIDRLNFTYTTTGTPQWNQVGSITTNSRLNATVASSVIGRPFGTSQVDQVSPFLFRNNWTSNINFNLKTHLSGRAGSFSLLTDAAFNQAFYYGKVEGDAIGDLVRRGFGWRWTGGAGSRFVNLVVHNGTTQTTVASSFAVTQEVAFDWDLYSDGAGNVTLYINGSQVATSSAGPTSYQSAGTYAWWREEAWTTAAPSFGNHTSYFRGGRAAILNY